MDDDNFDDDDDVDDSVMVQFEQEKRIELTCVGSISMVPPLLSRKLKLVSSFPATHFTKNTLLHLQHTIFGPLTQFVGQVFLSHI